MKTVLIKISDEDYDAMIDHLAKDKPGCRTVAVLPQSAEHCFVDIRDRQNAIQREAAAQDAPCPEGEESFSEWYQAASTRNAANWNK